MSDYIESKKPDKKLHDWQQGLPEAEYCIEQLTEHGGMVFDPFCGGGTTAVAAKRLGRQYLTTDIDEESVAIATERIENDSTER